MIDAMPRAGLAPYALGWPSGMRPCRSGRWALVADLWSLVRFH